MPVDLLDPNHESRLGLLQPCQYNWHTRSVPIDLAQINQDSTFIKNTISLLDKLANFITQ